MSKPIKQNGSFKVIEDLPNAVYFSADGVISSLSEDKEFVEFFFTKKVNQISIFDDETVRSLGVSDKIIASTTISADLFLALAKKFIEEKGE